MAYITKRGSSYGVRYTYQDEQGKNCNKWESFSTKEEATNRKKQIEHELANGTFLIPSTITVKEFLMEWLPKQCNKHKWAPCTYQSNLGTVQNLIIPYIGDMQMQKLKPYHLEDLYATLGKTPCGQYYEGKKQVLSEKQQQRLLSGTTIHEVHRLLRTAFQYAVGHPRQKPRSGGQPQEIDSGACHLGRGRDVGRTCQHGGPDSASGCSPHTGGRTA